MILFSIIIPTYNRAAFISKAIESVLSQSYANWELIVIDDASTDNTFELLAHYTDPRIRVVKNEVNKERSVSRNIGIALAKGEYICFLDSDDYLLPKHLENIALCIANFKDKIALFHTGVKQYHAIKNMYKDIYRVEARNAVETVIACHIPVISVAIHHTILKQYQFDAFMYINEDVYLFAQIASKFPIVYIPEVTVVWVLHGNNTTDQQSDYLTPQLTVTDKIVEDLNVRKYLSESFIAQKYFDLYSLLLFEKASKGCSLMSMRYFVKALCVNPFDKKNKSNLLNVIYHLPGGNFIKRGVALIKNKMKS